MHIPVNTHIINTPITIYINNKYYPKNCVAAIRFYCVASDARNYLIVNN